MLFQLLSISSPNSDLLTREPRRAGRLADSKEGAFLVTDFLDMRLPSSRSLAKGSGISLAAKLAKLHTTPAPIPEGCSRPVFGFPVPTCCGSTEQENDFTESWAEFFANRRYPFVFDFVGGSRRFALWCDFFQGCPSGGLILTLICSVFCCRRVLSIGLRREVLIKTTYRLLSILMQSEKNNGKDEALRRMIERTVDEIVPRLIGDDHLNGGNGVEPVLIHGDVSPPIIFSIVIC